METLSNYRNRIIIVTVIIILINILGYRFFTRLDFTADKRYTLSNATKNILKNLDDPITITAYFSKKLPPNVENTRKDFKDLLDEYYNWSKGKVVYEFLDPSSKTDIEKEAMQNGIMPVMINVREKNEMKQQKAYMGAVIKKGNEAESIPFIQPGAALEYSISSNIKKLTLEDKIKVGIIQGHGEPSLDEITQAKDLLSALYDVKETNLLDSSLNINDFKTLVWIAPKDSIKQSELNKVKEFIKNGGRLLVAINRVNGNFRNLMGTSINTGLEQWLASMGINVENKFVIDANAGQVTVTQRQGFFTFQTPVKFPYLPIITNFSNNSVTKGLEGVLFPFLSPVRYTAQDTSLKLTVLAKTSKLSGTKPANIYFNVRQQWTESDFQEPNIPVAIALEGKFFGGKNSKMIVIGDGDFAINGKGQQARQLEEDNVSLLVNAIDYLSDDTGLIELRTKSVKYRPIKKELDDNTKALIKYANFFLPILLVILYGIVRMQIRKRKKLNWRLME